MGRLAGGSQIEGDLEELRAALLDYHGQLGDFRDGLQKELPEPPEALILWRQCQALGVPLVEGGLLDQPHIWLLELAVVLDVETLFERLKEEPSNGPDTKANIAR